MSDMVPEVLNAALDSLFTPKEPGEQEYQGVDGLLYPEHHYPQDQAPRTLRQTSQGVSGNAPPDTVQ